MESRFSFGSRIFLISIPDLSRERPTPAIAPGTSGRNFSAARFRLLLFRGKGRPAGPIPAAREILLLFPLEIDTFFLCPCPRLFRRSSRSPDVSPSGFSGRLATSLVARTNLIAAKNRTRKG